MYGTSYWLQVLYASLQQFLFQFIGFIPKLLVALVIWIVGKYFLRMAMRLLSKVRVKKAKPLNKLMESMENILLPVGKVFLFLIVLDYLGVGGTVVQSLLSGLTFAIAIALGLAFGKALEPDAKAIVDDVKKQLEK